MSHASPSLPPPYLSHNDDNDHSDNDDDLFVNTNHAQGEEEGEREKSITFMSFGHKHGIPGGKNVIHFNIQTKVPKHVIFLYKNLNKI